MRDRYPQRFEFGWPPLWMELLGWLLLLLLLAALIGLAVWAITRATGRRGAPSAFGPTAARAPEWSPQGPDQALQAVRLRYAQGEISRDEYVRLVADLGGQLPAPSGPAPGQAPPGPPPGQAPAAPPPASGGPSTQQL
jgi:uncharacterized membrane protein